MSERNSRREALGSPQITKLLTAVRNLWRGLDQPVSQQILPQLTRRQFLAATAATAAAGLGSALVFRGSEKPSAPLPISDTPTPTSKRTAAETPVHPTPTAISPEAALQLAETYQDSGRVRILIDSDQIPLGYQLLNSATLTPTGEVSVFTPEQRQAFTSSRQLAIATGLPEVASPYVDDPTSLRSLWDDLDNYPASAEHPWISEIPKDVLSKEQLANYGIFIFQDESEETSKLLIRQSAFEEGGLLAVHKVANEGLKTEEKLTLKIVNSNGPFIWDTLIPESGRDQLTPDVISELQMFQAQETQGLETLRGQIATDLKKKLNSLKTQFEKRSSHPDKPMTDEEKDTILKQIQSTKLEMQLVSSFNVFELYLKIRTYFKSTPLQVVRGIYYENHNTLIYAGGGGHFQSRDRVFCTYNPDGTLELSTTNTLINKDTIKVRHGLPRVDASYLTAKETGYVDQPDQRGYVMTVNNISRTFRHELLHHILITALPFVHKRNLLHKVRWLNVLSTLTGEKKIQVQFPTRSETTTDELTYLTIKAAEKYLKENGDDKFYPFVFTIPKNAQQPDGGVMLGNNVHSTQTSFNI